MLILAHGHHGAALPPTRWLLPLHPAPARSPARRRSPCTGTKCALRWGTFLHLSTIWAASGAASSPWACLRLPASLFLSLRPPAAAGAHAAVVGHGAPHLRHLGRNLPAALRCHLRRALGRICHPGRNAAARRRPAAAEVLRAAHHALCARARRQGTANLASVGFTKSPDFLLGAAESPRHAEEDARESGADQRRLLVVLIVSRQAVREITFQSKSTLELVNSLVFHSGLRILKFACKCPSLSRTVQRIRPERHARLVVLYERF